MNSKLINSKKGYKLYRPYNSWDMNYHLIDTLDQVDYLIDICDIYDTLEDALEYGGITWSELKGLEDIPELIAISWKSNKL